MKMWRKKLTAVLGLGAMLATSGPAYLAKAEGEKSKPAPAIRVAPPSPVFPDAERVGELGQRRARVAQAIGGNSVMVLFSAEPRVYANDVYYEYRQENNLYYLTHLKQQGATLVLMPGNTQTPEILFLPRRIPQAEVWNGKMYAPAEAAARSGVKEIWDAREFKPFVEALKAKRPYRPAAENIFLSNVKADAASAMAHANLMGFERLLAAQEANQAKLYLLDTGRENREYRQERLFAQQFSEKDSVFKVESAHELFGEMRLIKSPSELKRLQQAIDITGEAFGRSMAVVHRVKWEYEVEAEVEYTFKRRNADFWGYPSIVGCGPNATTLHYETSQGEILPNSLLLMDIGAEYDHYTADVTRTFPVNGKFSNEQIEIYQIVFDAQEAVGEMAKPGVHFSALSQKAREVVANGLLKLGLITEPSQSNIWFMHGLGHWLGMNVHDVGVYGKLAPGMVFTNEPGIYIREDALDYKPSVMSEAAWEKFKKDVRPAFEKYKNIGVRIEDDLLVTPNGVEWMTRNIPRRIADVEATIAQARQELTAQADTENLWRGEVMAAFRLAGADAAQSGTTARRGFVRIGAHHAHEVE